MTNTQLLILATVLIAIYLYYQYRHSLPRNKTDFTENEVFFEAMDSETEEEELGEKKDWFGEQHWLSDAEIDWALERVIEDLPSERQTKYKFLESTQFMFARESMETKDAEARDSFPVLLSELTGWNGDLVFIPVNNPDFHWSCLVYEVKAKKFYHFDTLKGVNDSYVKPLTNELLKFLLESWQDPQFHFETRYHLQQGNSWDCGIAVIEITKLLLQNHSLIELGTFDFPKARQAWKSKLLDYYGK